MSDELMDARVRAAGERWRERTEVAPADPIAVTNSAVHTLAPSAATAPRRRSLSTWLTSAAAIAIVSIGLGVVVGVPGSDDPDKGSRPGTAEGSPALYNRRWTNMQIVDAKGKEVLGTSEAPPLLSYLEISPDGAIEGADGCKHLSGMARVDGTTINVGTLSRTDDACAGDRGDRAAAHVIARILAGRLTWTIKNEVLILRNGNGTLKLIGTLQLPDSIEGRNWQVTYLIANGSTMPAAGRPMLRIDDRQLAGTDGCNHISGSVAIDGRLMAVGPLTMTELACADNDVNATAAAVDKILTGTLTWRVDGDQLTLRGAKGTLNFGAVDNRGSFQPTIVGPTWRLDSVEENNGGSGSGSSGSDYPSIWIRFTDNAVRIHHACYVNRGHVVTASDTVTITDVTLVEANPCPSDANSPADEPVDAVLSGKVSWVIGDGELRLTKGATTLHFVADPDQPVSNDGSGASTGVPSGPSVSSNGETVPSAGSAGSTGSAGPAGSAGSIGSTGSTGGAAPATEPATSGTEVPAVAGNP